MGNQLVIIDGLRLHDFQPVLHGTCTPRPETTNMRSLLARLADEARIDGNSLASAFTEEAEGKGDVQAKPVDALPAYIKLIDFQSIKCIINKVLIKKDKWIRLR